MADNQEVKVVITAFDQTKAAFMSLNNSLQRLKGDINASSGSFAGFFNIFASRMGAISAVTAVFTALGVAIKKTANDGEEFLKISQQIGISVEKLSTLKYAAEMSETTFEDLTSGVGKFAKTLAEADSGDTKLKKLLSELRVTSRDPYEAMMQLADAFSQMRDGSGKTAVAMELFGKNGKALIPFFNEGAAGIKKLQSNVEEFSTASAKAADEFNDNITTLKRHLSDFTHAIGNDYIPKINAFFDLFRSGEKRENAIVKLFGSTEDVRKMEILKEATEKIKAVKEKIDNLKKKDAPKIVDKTAQEEQRAAIDASLKITQQGLKTSESLRLASIKTEVKMLEEKYKTGIISEEEYINEKNNLEAQALQTSITFSQTEQKALTNAWNKKKDLFYEEKDKIKEQGKYKAEMSKIDEEIAKKTEERNRIIIQGKIDIIELSKKEAQAKRDGELKLLEAEINLRKQLNAIKIEKGDMTDLEAKKQELNLESELIYARIEKLKADKTDASSERKLALDYEILALEKDMLAVEEQLNETRTQMSGTFTEGMERGFKQWLSEAKTTFQQAVQFARDCAQAMESAFEDFFFDALQGKMKSLRDYFVSFANSIQKAIANLLAQQATRFIVTSIASFFANAGTASTNQGVDSSGYGAAAATRHQGGYIPRFHVAGLASDERFAINKVGERYITKEQNEWLTGLAKNMQGNNQNPISVVVNVENKSSQPLNARKGDIKITLKEIVTNIILEDKTSNGPIAQMGGV